MDLTPTGYSGLHTAYAVAGGVLVTMMGADRGYGAIIELDAYTRYLRGFEEIASLKISGAYHDYDLSNSRDTLHLFGVTSSEPPVPYYRTVQNLYLSEINDSNRRIVWGPWRQINVQIPVREVSPIAYRGRLYVFWVEISTRPNSPSTDTSTRSP